MKKVFVWFFGKRAVGANQAVKGHWWAVALLVISISGAISLPFVWNKMFYTNMPPNQPADTIAEAPSYPEGTSPVSATASATVSATNQVAQTLAKAQAAGATSTYVRMEAGTGKAAETLAEAAQEKAKANSSEVRAKAEEMRLIGAYLIGRAAEQREEALAAIEVVKANLGRREAAYRINLLEAEASSANARQIKDEGVRIYYKGRRLEAEIQLEEARDVLPEVRTKMW